MELRGCTGNCQNWQPVPDRIDVGVPLHRVGKPRSVVTTLALVLIE